ncbi:regulator of G-protein signaling 11 isoform X1 [Dendroctonus ponderosae]|uniref:regulator of G-protein signaling 11 isoform X1 n=1 Tax=Dendroctonus ponderosae TaxID=77166 RepID=UPI002034FA74|nr:regulator of G-protein signaling 11 isoform X1 [Dendroctonus ponderosae]XP_048522455.1 regulator of G-protein signaling 11 isoform X1 [Dendroctonus ponderosae]
MELDQRDCFHRPKAFDKMEELLHAIEASGGVPVGWQKSFLTSVPKSFAGSDLVEWLIVHLDTDEMPAFSESMHIANQLCQYGYLYPISDSKNLLFKEENAIYRFQSPSFWPWSSKTPDNIEYAIYLLKRSLRNKQKHGLEDYELEAMASLRRNLSNKWDLITNQAQEQVNQLQYMTKNDKLVSDADEKAFWRIYRPPPGFFTALEQVPVPTRCWNGMRPRKKTIDDYRRETELLKTRLSRTRVKASQALESLINQIDTYSEYDCLLSSPPSGNPWVNDDITYWTLNAPLVEIPTEKRVRKWALSMEDLLSDPTGVQEFTQYLRKEKSEENILFCLAVIELRRSAQSQVLPKIRDIFDNYLKHGSPCEVNIDCQTMERVQEGMKLNSRFCFDAAQEHVYNLLLKKDCYPRFIRSEYYKTLLANGVQTLQKRRFFGFGPAKKKASVPAQTNPVQPSQITGCVGALSKRRGSDRSLTGSAHEISHFGVSSSTQTSVIRDTKVSHSHSQTNLSDIPYRGDLDLNKTSLAVTSSPIKKSSALPGVSTAAEEVCPWDTPATPPRTPISNRKNSATHIDSESSSSDVSVGVAEIVDKIQCSSSLTQQHTLDCGKKLHVDSSEAPRRASVSVPLTHSTSGMEGTRRKVSSFEDNCSSIFVIASEKDNKPKDNISISSTKVLQKSYSVAKTPSISCVAPIISVSSVKDEMIITSCEQQSLNEQVTAGQHPTSLDITVCDSPSQSHSEPVSPPIIDKPKAPLAEPDCESPGSELQPSEVIAHADSSSSEVRTGSKHEVEVDETKNTDVCPWEDEENCRLDSPFVKKYATLGYL